MSPKLTQEQIDELESRGIMTPATSQSMRSQLMSEMEDTPKPILDKVLMDTMTSREQDNADTISNKIAEDAASDPELKDIVERTSMRLQELTRDPKSIGATPGQRWNAGVANNASTSGITPPPPPVEMVEDPMVLTPPVEEVPQAPSGPNPVQMKLDALDMQGQAAMMRAQQAQDAGNAQAGFLDNTAAKLQAIENNRLLERADLESRRNEQLNKVEQSQAKFDTMQIDPNRFYGSRTTEQNVLLNLGLALSVFGGNTKEYTENINKAIDRDIEIQKEQINLQGSKVTGARNVLSDMMEVTQDVDKAADLAKAGMLKQAELKGAAMAARVSNADAKAKLLETVADLQMKRADLMASVTAPDSIDQQLAAKSAMKGPQVLTEEMVRSVLKSDPKKAAFIIPGIGMATDGDITKRDVMTKATAAESMMDKLAELKKLREQQTKMGSVFPSSLANRGKILAADIMLEGKKVAGLGVLNEKDYALMESILPLDPLRVQYNPADLLSFGIQRVSGDPLLDRIDALEKRTREGLSSNLKNTMIGLTPEFYEKMIAPGRGANLRSKLKEVETPKAVR